MPLTKQAIKKMHHDKKVTAKNLNTKVTIKQAIKEVRKKPTKSGLEKAFSLLDKAAKGKFIHKNKASRLKSRMAKLFVKNK